MIQIEPKGRMEIEMKNNRTVLLHWAVSEKHINTLVQIGHEDSHGIVTIRKQFRLDIPHEDFQVNWYHEEFPLFLRVYIIDYLSMEAVKQAIDESDE